MKVGEKRCDLEPVLMPADIMRRRDRLGLENSCSAPNFAAPLLREMLHSTKPLHQAWNHLI